MRKHCFPDSFNVTCAHDEVIVMTAARYGRMSKGHCLTSDYQVGCWADVLHHVDRKCSGRRHCVIAIPDTVLHNLHPCQKDLFAYLESEHVCQKGVSSTSIHNKVHAIAGAQVLRITQHFIRPFHTQFIQILATVGYSLCNKWHVSPRL